MLAEIRPHSTMHHGFEDSRLSATLNKWYGNGKVRKKKKPHQFTQKVDLKHTLSEAYMKKGLKRDASPASRSVQKFGRCHINLDKLTMEKSAML